jgi:hypothetical protein
MSILRKQLGGAALERAWNKGAMMTIEQAIEFALKETKQ